MLEGKPGSGKFTSISMVLPCMEYLLEHLEKVPKSIFSLPGGSSFKISVQAGWDKLDKYYKLLKDSPVYVASVVLDPRYRWAWLEHKWATRPQWLINARVQVQVLWEKEYRYIPLKDDTNINLTDDDDDEPPEKRQKYSSDFDNWVKESQPPRQTRSEDEYAHWVRSSVDIKLVEDPIDY